MPAGRPILLTGASRSGTTWVGSLLAAAPEVVHLYEPFNRPTPPVWARSWPFDRQWRYVCDDNERTYRQPVADLLSLRPPLHALAAARSPRAAVRRGRQVAAAIRDRAAGRRPLVKDPIAFFLAPWLAERFDAHVVVLVRHPGAVAAGFKRMGWTGGWEELLEQPLLLRDHLGGFRTELEAAAGTGAADPVDAAVLWWRLIYTTAARWRDEHPDWTFVSYEALAAEPHRRVPALYDGLGLTWTPGAARLVTSLTTGGSPVLDRQHVLERDSAEAASSWPSRLTADELRRVHDATAEAALDLFGYDDWPAVVT